MEDGETYSAAVLAVYAECWRVCRPGAVLVLVTGNYVRKWGGQPFEETLTTQVAL